MPKTQPKWIPENEAAAMMAFKPQTLRRKVKRGANWTESDIST
ncbi:MAG TPA: hypothetical protein VD794_07765 [Flavisolibacter sp.]|nr:hypothetical protein [Flavisolibacter sp.]